ncbi:MAG: DUF2723 domain-containing protein [Acidobacteria bacterium]|nr:DUF2723 domain-containing protein [Acidobacteriota bacterium]
MTRLDGALAALAAAMAFGVYLATMFPGLSSSGDAAKFAFVGKVLGIPHEPGYPLYVLVSHLFSYLPLGSLAYRANLFSAVLAALSVAIGYFLVRSLGGGRVAAFSATLGMGFGRAFWGKALYAKAYPLNAVLVAAGMLMLLRWGVHRRRKDLYWAAGIFALSAANHLIVIALLPALLLYALLTNARELLRPRTLVVIAALVMFALTLYGVIPLRTWQQAPYLEARATSLSELVDVMMARRYWNEIGAFSVRALLSVRMPTVTGLVGREFTWIGLPLLAAGFLVLARRKPREALLCGLGALGVMTLTANMSSNEDEGFLLPVFILWWPVVGVGLQGVFNAVRRAPPTVAGVLAIGLTAVIPARQVTANYEPNDHHRRTFEIRYFDALFARLPDRSAFVGDTYGVNMMVFYKLYGEQAAGTRDVRWIPSKHEQVAQAWRDGYDVLAFGQGRRDLVDYGFQFEPVALLGEPVSEYLPVVRDRWIVAIAAAPGAVPGLKLTDGRPWNIVGATRGALAGRPRAPYGLVGAMGAHGPGLEATWADGFDLFVEAGHQIGRTGVVAPVSIRVAAGAASAVVTVDGVERARTERGAVIAIINPLGEVEAHALDPQWDLRVPFDMRLLPLYRLTRAGTCADLGSDKNWRDVSAMVADGRAAVRIDNFRSFEGRMILYLSADGVLAPTVTRTRGRGRPLLTFSTFATGNPSERDALQRALQADGLLELGPLAAAASISRLEVRVNDEGDFAALTIDFGGRPARATMRAEVDQNTPERATICGMSAR